MSQQTNAGFNAPRLSVCPDAPLGAGPEVRRATHATSTVLFCPSGVLPVSDIAPSFGVRPPFGIGVGHGAPVEPLPAMRRADGASWQIGGPAGISSGLQVSANSGEPFASIEARNLLSNDRCRAALGDEAVKSGPEVALVGMATSLSSDRKRLTWKGRGPDFSVSGETGEVKRAGPSADAGEEVALPKRSKVGGIDVEDASLIDIAFWQFARPDQLLEP